MTVTVLRPSQLTQETVAHSYAVTYLDCETAFEASQVWRNTARVLHLDPTSDTHRSYFETYADTIADVRKHECCDYHCEPVLSVSGRGFNPQPICDGYQDRLLAARDDALVALMAQVQP